MADTPLFDTDAYRVAPEPAPALSPDRRRTLRQAAQLGRGRHPLTGGRLNPQAAPAGDRAADGRRCGNCWYRQLVLTNGNRRWPKCLRGATNPTDTRPGTAPWVTGGPATDVRAWWPACGDHSYGAPGVSDDAARWVPGDG